MSVLPLPLPLSDENLARLMRIVIEGPEREFVDFDAILDIFKQSNRRITLYTDFKTWYLHCIY